ncbi:MAG: universal stress protein [Polyangiaceae bacterium]|nr:universal stress protein [Polyangiaceae bacterium]
MSRPDPTFSEAQGEMGARVVLVPLDGSSHADGVLAQAKPLMERADLELVLFTAVDPIPNRYSLRPLRSEDAVRVSHHVAQARAHLDELSSVMRAEGRAVRTEVRVGVGADAILSMVDAIAPDLVVMRSRVGRGAAWRFGSVSRRVLRHCPVPLLLLAPETPPSEISNILIPLDGSERSERVLPHAIELASAFDAAITLCRFAATAEEFIDAPEPGLATPERLRATLSKAREVIEDRGLRARVRVGVGDPATRIVEIAEEEGVDLIAMATHGRSGWSRWLFGSVADHVFSVCERPLLVVRGAAPAEQT